MPIKNWSTTPANNNSASPNGAPEGMAPSAVNDVIRQQMADHATQWRDAEWFDRADTPSRASGTTFKIGSDVTGAYLANRAIKCLDGSTLYGIITASTYSAPDTTVTVNLDSGSLTASLTSVALAILSPTNRSLPTAFGRKGADVASAATIDLSTCAGDFCDVTGTTTITAITSEAAGIRRKVRFTGALTFTHNATSLILPGGANITTANGDTADLISLGSGNWLCFSYTKASGEPIAPFADTSPIVAGSADATKKVRIEADGITTATTRVWTAPDSDIANFLIQRVSTQSSAAVASSTTTPADDTIPQSTEGVELLTLSITPKKTSHILEIEAVLLVSGSAISQLTVALFQDSGADAIAAMGQASSTTDSLETVKLIHRMSAGTTSATTFKIRGGASTGNITMNGFASNRKYGGIAVSSLSIKEYAA